MGGGVQGGGGMVIDFFLLIVVNIIHSNAVSVSDQPLLHTDYRHDQSEVLPEKATVHLRTGTDHIAHHLFLVEVKALLVNTVLQPVIGKHDVLLPQYLFQVHPETLHLTLVSHGSQPQLLPSLLGGRGSLGLIGLEVAVVLAQVSGEVDDLGNGVTEKGQVFDVPLSLLDKFVDAFKLLSDFIQGVWEGF